MIETPSHKKESEDPLSATNDIIVAYQSEQNNIWDTLPVMYGDVMDPINSNRRIAAPTTGLDSPGDAEYWDPVTNSYRSKRTNDKVPDDIYPEEDTSAGYESDSSIETSPTSSTESDPWEYWDPITDYYRRTKD